MATPSPDLQGTLVRLLEQQEELLRKVTDLQKPSGKDRWDKLGALSGVLIAVVGGLFSFLYSYHQSKQDEITQNHQTKLQEIQTVGTFMPYLVGTDDIARSIALSELRDILSAKTAIMIAVRVNAAKTSNGNANPDPVVVNFLQDVAKNGSNDEQTMARQAIEKVRRVAPVSEAPPGERPFQNLQNRIQPEKKLLPRR
jgi:hypothetical protein